MATVNHAKWTKGKKFSPNSLILDPGNFRISSSEDAPLSQADIRERLIEEEGVRELANQIASKGWIPVEDIVVLREGGKHLVVEGNRRVCALQLLKNPKRAPQKHRKAFQGYADKAASLPARVHCVLAPNRAEAEVYIFSKHADDSFSRSWSRIQQSTFIASKLREGQSVEEVIVETGVSRKLITRSMVALDLFAIAGRMDLKPAVKEVLTSSKSFPFTALAERIFGTSEACKLLGVKPTTSGLKGEAGTRDGFLGALEKIFEDVVLGDEAATRLYGTKEKTMERLRAHGYEAKGSGGWDLFAGKTPIKGPIEDEDEQPKPPKPPRPRPRSKKDWLLPPDLELEVGGTKLRLIIEEAQRLDVYEHPAASAILLRTILELALYEAISARSGCEQALAADEGKGLDRFRMKDLLVAVKKATTLNLNLDHQARRGLENLIAHGPLSAENLHLFVHNKHWLASGESVIALREPILPIIRRCLQKPA